jgi:hypothetical protein
MAKPAMFNDIAGLKNMADIMHKELLEAIQTLSDVSASSEESLVCAHLTSHTSK